MTALQHLDWRHSINEKSIPRQDLVEGFTRYVWPLLIRLRPRIVCALTNRVWDIAASKIDRRRVVFLSCPDTLPRLPIVFRLPDAAFVTMLVKTHNHLSRFLSNAQMSEIGRACRWFLGRPNLAVHRTGARVARAVR